MSFFLPLLILGILDSSGFSESLTINDQKLQCLKEAKLLYIWAWNTNECYIPLDDCPGRDGMWLVRSQEGDELVCEERRCEPPLVYMNGICQQSKESACNQPGTAGTAGTARGMLPLPDIQGNTTCFCSNGWIQGSDGRCHLLFTRGNCQAGQVIVTRSLALSVKDVPCDQGYSCRQKCPEMEQFADNMVEFYQYHGFRCSEGGREGVCCPESTSSGQPIEDQIRVIAKRFDLLNQNVGVCIDNACPRNQTLYYKQASDVVKEPDDPDLDCIKTDGTVEACESELKYTDEYGLYCCGGESEFLCFEPLSVFGSTYIKKCPRGYFYRASRGGCVRGFG